MSGKTKSGKPRQNPGVKGPNPHLKAMRKREAEERNAKWAALSPGEQIASINDRVRPGSCQKQITRILKKLVAAEQKPAKK